VCPGCPSLDRDGHRRFATWKCWHSNTELPHAYPGEVNDWGPLCRPENRRNSSDIIQCFYLLAHRFPRHHAKATTKHAVSSGGSIYSGKSGIFSAFTLYCM
jgi:hypothetical protein